jgi:putative acetyltransferase
MSEEGVSAVRVRAMEAADWRDLHDLWSQPEVIWGTSPVPRQSADAVKQKIENPPEGLVRLVAEIDGRVGGAASLHPGGSPRRRHAAGLGMMVHPEYWHQGVGTALLQAVIDLAGNWLNISRLELTVFIDNAVAIHLYEKAGFRIEGTHRAYVFRDGEYVDTYFMARIRERVSPEGRSGS